MKNNNKSWIKLQSLKIGLQSIILCFTLKEVAEKSISTVLTETKKLREKFEKEGSQITPKIEATIKQVYDSALKTANDFKTQAEAAVNSIAKKN